MEIINRIGSYLQAGRSWYTRDVKNIKVFSIHHSASLMGNKPDDVILQELMADHTNQGWAGLSYHFVIIRDKIYQINAFNWVTWVDSINWDCVGICVVGYFHPPYNEMPSDENKKALRWLLDELSTKHPEFPASQGDAYGHRERFATACPGDNLFPLVLEYRSKLGAVAWGSYQSLPVTTPPVQPTQSTSTVDSTPPVSNPPVAPIVNPAVTPAATVATTDNAELQRQLEEAKGLLQEKTASCDEMSKKYSGFVALGYNTVDDVQKAFDKKNAENLGLQTLILQLKESRGNLANEIAKIDQEDYTAIEAGIAAAKDLHNLKKDFETTIIALEAKPDMFNILKRISDLRDLADKAIKILQKDRVISPTNVQQIDTVEKQAVNHGMGFLTKLFISGSAGGLGILTVFLFSKQLESLIGLFK